ncbi:MAG TPA: hypothetical protein VMX12_12955 [Acidimicrobiia bacterium]|nr:hypothetical protein [Acidimicrobiia bacterium]
MSDPATARIFEIHHDIYDSELPGQPAAEGVVFSSGLVYIRWHQTGKGEDYESIEALLEHLAGRGMDLRWPETVEHQRKELPK